MYCCEAYQDLLVLTATPALFLTKLLELSYVSNAGPAISEHARHQPLLFQYGDLRMATPEKCVVLKKKKKRG
jgi:hypothetical protein